MCNEFTYCLLVIQEDLTIVTFDKMCNVTHKLLVIEKDMTRLPFTKCAIHSLSIDHNVVGRDVMRLPFIKMAMSLTSCRSKKCEANPHKNDQCHSLAISHRKRCDESHETAFHKNE